MPGMYVSSCTPQHCCNVTTMQALLLSAARTYMFSTALPLPLVAAAHAALDVARHVPAAACVCLTPHILPCANWGQTCMKCAGGACAAPDRPGREGRLAQAVG